MSAGARQFGKLKKRAVRWLKRRRTGAVRRAKRWQRQKSRWQRAQTKRLTAAWRRRKGPLKTRWKRLNRKTNYWPQVVWLSLENFAAHQGLTMASVIAFSAFISLFPLALLILSLANSVLPPTEALAQWTTFLNVITPGGADIWRVNTPFLTNRRLAVQIGSVVVLLWTGSSVLAVISRTLDRAWQVEHRVHKIILLRMRAVPLALLAAALLALTFAASSGLRLAPFINRAGELHLLLRGGLGLLLVAADVAIFWGSYLAVPAV
ncbi:MAG: YhjD/YihY/BrkB family envelope integrity protein, partial [Anaerolineae bacterium]